MHNAHNTDSGPFRTNFSHHFRYNTLLFCVLSTLTMYSNEIQLLKILFRAGSLLNFQNMSSLFSAPESVPYSRAGNLLSFRNMRSLFSGRQPAEFSAN